ncbi:hypothetical protein G3M48_006332 [Beauveria asiatica]|uniref:Uncharacterized protein n=1 Tax=Beauveria asiatica TaxID=1069075 RepID=A0AAW0S5T0_9HYPO
MPAIGSAARTADKEYHDEYDERIRTFVDRIDEASLLHEPQFSVGNDNMVAKLRMPPLPYKSVL